MTLLVVTCPRDLCAEDVKRYIEEGWLCTRIKDGRMHESIEIGRGVLTKLELGLV